MKTNLCMSASLSTELVLIVELLIAMEISGESAKLKSFREHEIFSSVYVNVRNRSPQKAGILDFRLLRTQSLGSNIFRDRKTE